jgi:hypothetical protein
MGYAGGNGFLMLKPPAKWFLWAGVVMALLLVCLAVLITQALPVYVEERLVPKLAGAFDLVPEQVQARRVGVWGADLGPIRLSRDQAPAIAVSAIQLDYNPLSLLQGKVAGITLVGLEVAVEMGPDRLAIAGVEVPASAHSSAESGTPFKLDTLWPITLERLSLVHSRFKLVWQENQYLLPVELHLETAQLKSGILKGQATISLLGNPVRLTASIDQQANQARVALNAEAVSLRRLAALLPAGAVSDMTGTADLSAGCRIGLAPLQFSGLSMTARFDGAQVTTPYGRLQTQGSGGRPLVVSLAGERLTDLEWSGAPFTLEAPFKLKVSALQGRLAVDRQSWSLRGLMETSVPRQIVGGAELPGDIPLQWTLTARSQPASDRIEMALHSRESGPISVSLGENRLSSRKLTVGIDGHYEKGALAAEAQILAEDLGLSAPQARFQAPAATVSATVRMPPPGAGNTAALAATAKLANLQATSASSTLHIPQLVLELTGRSRARHPWGLSGQLRLTDGRFEDRASDLSAEGLSLLLPLAWPAASAMEPGRLAAAAIRWKGHSMGGLGGILGQTAAGLEMDLRHTSALIPGMNAMVKGRLGPAGGGIELHLPPHEMASDLDLGRLVPAAAGILGRARISAYAELSLGGHGPKGFGRLKVSGGRIHQEAHNLLLEEIDLAVRWDDLFKFKSAPQQRLQVARLALGELKAQQLAVDFQIESPQTLFIEKAGLMWCQGQINTSALRIDSTQADYDLVLYCDRLNLADLLEQLGAAQASGQGSVNGRIPIRFQNDRLSFDNGFLYSTPGQSGTIRLSGTGALVKGLPPGSPQHTQLEIATEALKDYSYQWAKLQLKSEAEILLLKLQLDGKPNRLLPFAYNQALGRFERVAGAGQAEFKGISIDLNFRSPLNEIIRYKNLLNPK